MKRLIILCYLLSACSISYAKDKHLYAMDGGFGTPYFFQIDKKTGAITDTYTNLSGYDGRGIAVVGDTVYYTAVLQSCVVLCIVNFSPPNVPAFVYSYNLRTHTDNGALFTVPSGLSAITFDGKDFYFADGSGGNKVYKYSMTGTLLNTITLSLCAGSCDGLEYFERGGTGYLVANRGYQTGPYDLYDLSGNLVTEAFINPGSASSQAASRPTGIAFDGNHFFTTGWLGGEISEWTADGVFIRLIAPAGKGCCGFEDLSFDHSAGLGKGKKEVGEQ